MKNNVPEEFADFYYLRELDLYPERLGDLPYYMGIEQCREFYKQGWLFHTREDAMRVREVMVRAYISEVMRLKGSQGVKVEFVRPLCP